MGEIAEVAGDPKETIRSRLNRGVSDHRKTTGWARFDVPNTLNVAVHAEMMRRVGIEQVAIKTANFVAESIQNYLSCPPHSIRRSGQLGTCYLVFRRSDDIDFWSMHWCKDNDEALLKVGQYMADSSIVEGAAFLTVNAGTIADWALDRIFDLQEIDGNTAEASQ